MAGFSALLVVVAGAAFLSPWYGALLAFAGIGLVGGMALFRAREIDLHEQVEEVHREANREEKERLYSEREALGRELLELRETARSLELDRHEARTASMAKGAFLAHMSHEIRTPLNGILGMCRLLGETELTREQRDFNDTTLQSAESLLKLLDNILDLSKIEAGKLELEEAEFDLHDSLEKTVQLLSPKAADKGLELICCVEPDVPQRVLGDSSRLRQVVLNLLGNSIKFTKTGEVVLGVSVDDATEDEGSDEGRIVLRIVVRDTGPGIAEDRVQGIFEPFAKDEGAEASSVEGKGLGLTIGRQLAQTMGGDMGVETQEGEGSLFWFTAVLHRVEEQAEPADAHGPGEQRWNALRSMRVLLVDDNASQRTVIERYLKRWEVDCVAVESRQQALATLARGTASGSHFDVGLIDSDLDGTDGIELAQALLQDRSVEPPQLVLLKDGRCQYKANRLTRIGFDAWISKPVWPNVLREALMHLRDVAEQVEVRDALRRESTVAAAPSEPEALKFDYDVLLAEDNLVNQKVATLLLQKLGCSVDVASNGQKTVEAARAKRYDMIFMDCQMPVMDGYEATRAIRSSGVREHLPIVAMTASAMAEDRRRSLDAGMNDHLSKPVNLEQLRSAIERWGPGVTPTPHATQVNPMTDTFEVLSQDVVASLRELSDGESDLFAELVELFLEDTPPRLEALHVALDSADPKALEAAAHGLKSSCANIGALAMAELCRRIEALGREAQVEGAGNLVERSDEEFARVREALSAELAG